MRRDGHVLSVLRVAGDVKLLGFSEDLRVEGGGGEEYYRLTDRTEWDNFMAITLIALAVSATHAGRDDVTIANLFQSNASSNETTLLET